MARVLLLNGPSYGHINPTIGLVKELSLRGENIVYFATEDFRKKIEKAGAEVKIYNGFDFGNIK